MPEREEVTFENARIIYRNFEGRETMFKPKGYRSFTVVLEDEVDARNLAAQGWNVKWPKDRDVDDEEDIRNPTLEVAVKYSEKARPPKVVMITADTGIRTNLDEDTIGSLDWADIVNVDFIIRPYYWDVGGKQGKKAYLKSMFITIEEDELDRKYAAVPESHG